MSDPRCDWCGGRYLLYPYAEDCGDELDLCASCLKEREAKVLFPRPVAGFCIEEGGTHWFSLTPVEGWAPCKARGYRPGGPEKGTQRP